MIPPPIAELIRDHAARSRRELLWGGALELAGWAGIIVFVIWFML